MLFTWQDRLDSASTGPAVVVIAHDFAAQFSLTAARIHRLATFSASASIRIWQLTGHSRAGKTTLNG